MFAADESPSTTNGLRTDLEPWLEEIGSIFRRFDQQDSGNVAYGVDCGGERLFVKQARVEANAAGLRRAEAVGRAFLHPALPPFRNAFGAKDGRVVVFDWVEGEVLYDVRRPREERIRAADSAHARFRILPLEEVVSALGVIFDAHVGLAAAGFVASDFYDGCILYDFRGRSVSLCDLDEYRPGPWRLATDRNFGSSRFMAPEEFVRGSVIDERTNVFTMGRAARVLLGDGTGDPAPFRGTPAMRRVLSRATRAERDERYESLAAFASAWTAAVESLSGS